MATTNITNGVKALNGANGADGDHKRPIKIVVVGAGIGGLTAAIALRQQGHEVTILEQSRFGNESGAAIHLAPNSNGILRRLGLYAEEVGANLMQRLTEYTSTGELKRTMPVVEANSIWQHPWLMAHRVHLHNLLKEKATSIDGKGKPAELRTSSKVVDVDCETATVYLQNGETVQGDVVIGADGVHSVTRRKVPGGDVQPFSSGKSAFRFLISREDVLRDPKTSKFAQDTGELVIWYGPDRRIVAYPCQRNELLNFACIHPAQESDASGDWNQTGSRDKLLEIFKDFDPAVLHLIGKVDPKTLKVWNLLDMDVIPNWVHGRFALLGDAAHPFLPHQGQGGGCAIEDAASLAVMLSPDIQPSQIPERLSLYQTTRYERAGRIQEYSRIAGMDIAVNPKLDMHGYANYNFGHDEWDYSTQVLRKHIWAQTPSMYWRMPIGFGPMPGPRQDFEGLPRSATASTFTTASIKFRTSRTLLQNLFPTTSFTFSSPGTVAYASFSQTTLGKMAWLGGGGYNHLGLYLHGVQYRKRDGTLINGTHMPLLFESLADPILTGREELGMPKLYTAIDVHRRASSYHITTSWQGAAWGTFTWPDLVEVDPNTESGTIGGEADDGIIVYRVIPSVGTANKGKPDAEYPVFVPHKEESKVVPSKVNKVWKSDKASFHIDPLDWDQLPTMHHIIQRLAEVPVFEVVSAKVVEGVGVPDVSSAVRIE